MFKAKIKAPEKCSLRRYNAFVVDFEHNVFIVDFDLVHIHWS